ncbi:MAG: hypothetical protein JXN64_03255 [Spirochaetes bacterium]|nr:hypothetical protein [Spirochaetota bacterium]
MDVTLNTNYLPATKTNINAGATETDTQVLTLNANTEIKFDYNDVTMDLEEIQDFLFMLIGSESPGKTPETEKGKNLNLLV